MKQLFFLILLSITFQLYGMEKTDASSAEQKVIPYFGKMSGEDKLLKYMVKRVRHIYKNRYAISYKKFCAGLGCSHKNHSAFCIFQNCHREDLSDEDLSDNDITVADTYKCIPINLIKKGYLDNLKREDGSTPFLLACRWKSDELVSCFIDHSKNKDELFKQQDVKGRDAIAYATMSYWGSDCETIPFLKWLLSERPQPLLSSESSRIKKYGLHTSDPRNHTVKWLLDEIAKNETALFKLATGPTENESPNVIRSLPLEVRQLIFQFVIERSLKKSAKTKKDPSAPVSSSSATADNT